MHRHVAAAILFLALSIAMTWPLAANLDRAVADPGDPYITIWVLDWDWWATMHQPLSLFHANAFHPARYSLAYSENLYGLAVLLFPLRAVGVGPVAAQNLALLAGFAFCGFAAYLLGLRLTGSWTAGVAAGVFYAFLPFRFVHLAHVQHVWGGWLPLLLLMLLRYSHRPTRGRAIAFAAVFVMNGLTNVHFLLFGAFASAVTALLLVPRSAWRELAIAMAGALVVMLPFLYPYAIVAKQYGMQRSYAEVFRYSATVSSWLARTGEPELRLFPGWLAFLCMGLALIVAWRRGAQLALAWLWIAIGFFGSLGLHFVFHEFLFGAVPGFRAVRVPARWAVIAYIGMAILIALVTAWLPRRLRWIVPLAFAFELWTAPVRWFLLDPVTPPVYTWIAQQPVRAFVELPIDTLGEYEAMLRATVHHKPMVNGISGFAPPERVAISSAAYTDTFVDELVRAGVDHVVVHADRRGVQTPKILEWLRRELDRGRIRFVGRFDAATAGDWVFAIGSGGVRSPQLDAFLRGATVCDAGTSGWLDFPTVDSTFRGEAVFSGWTYSPHGIRSVDLWLDNRRERFVARLKDEQTLCGRGKRFVLVLPQRPHSVSIETDVQVEVTDGRGVKSVYDDRWFVWRDAAR